MILKSLFHCTLYNILTLYTSPISGNMQNGNRHNSVSRGEEFISNDRYYLDTDKVNPNGTYLYNLSHNIYTRIR